MKILLITDTQFGMCDDNLSSEKWSKIAKSWSLPESGIEKEKRNLKNFIDFEETFFIDCQKLFKIDQVISIKICLFHDFINFFITIF